MLMEADNVVFVFLSPRRLIKINCCSVFILRNGIYIYLLISCYNLHCQMNDKVLAGSHPLIPVPSIKCLHFFFDV